MGELACPEEVEEGLNELGLVFAVGPVARVGDEEEVGAASEQRLRFLVGAEVAAKIFASRYEEGTGVEWGLQAIEGSIGFFE